MTTHHTGAVVETGLRNSQDAGRLDARGCTVFLPPYGGAVTAPGPLVPVNGTWTWSRQAGPPEFIRCRRTAAAANHNPGYEWHVGHSMLGMHVSDAADAQQQEEARGIRITSFDLVYSVTAEAMDAQVATLATGLYANAVATANVERPITGTLGLAIQATPYVTRLTVTTPFILSPLMYMVLAVRVDDTTGGGADYDALGLGVNFDVLL